MKYIITSLLFSLVVSANAKSFRKLNSRDAIEITQIAETEGYKNIDLLAINKSKKFTEIPLIIEFIINQDTLTDYTSFSESLRRNLKTLYLLEKDTLKVRLRLLSEDSISVKVKGNITIKEPMVLASSGTPISKSLIGNYWDVKQPCIFKFIKHDTIPETLKVNIDFTENFAFDKLFFQINIIQPDSTFSSVEEEFVVQKGDVVSLNSIIIESTKEIDLKLPGKYIIEINPVMKKRRINGIKSVGYKRLKK